jgi:hypothetical protein
MEANQFEVKTGPEDVKKASRGGAAFPDVKNRQAVPFQGARLACKLCDRSVGHLPETRVASNPWHPAG